MTDALMSLNFLISTGSIEKQVHRKGAEDAEGNVFLIQSGEGDWIRSCIPPGLRSGLQWLWHLSRGSSSGTKVLLFGGLSPPN